MKITRKGIARKMADYLHHRIKLEELSDRAENMMMEAEFENDDFLSRLGYHARVLLTDSSSMAAAES